ncbi:peptide deformylase [bacterium]|jgi:peptide deformylase|nr:peptide deformylase [bacterium]
MARLVVVQYPNPILKQQTEKIIVFDERLKSLISDMFETMKANSGLGLAGPQVGILEKIFVLKYKRKKMVIINPVIDFFSDKKEIGEEGCLSIPNRQVHVERSVSVKMTAQNELGKVVEIKEKGLMARILQHEVDHLNGILILDREVPSYELDGI